MKNIHVLPTDKPSRLSILNSGKLNFGAEIMSSSNSKPQHIYITSDEEIKDVDWCLDLYRNKLIQATKDNLEQLHNGGFSTENIKYSKMFKKIILTTDQSLDGVQAIDDEFLEWFVNNANCEMVEVYELYGKLYAEPIIPKEEPKQVTLEEAGKFIVFTYQDSEDWTQHSIPLDSFEKADEFAQQFRSKKISYLICRIIKQGYDGK